MNFESLAARGERHGCAKLTAFEIQIIKLWLAAGFKQQEVADAFSMSLTQIHRIHRGRSRAEVSP